MDLTSTAPPDDSTTTTYPAVILTHDWCPPERPYPESVDAARAEDPARCVAEDPCLDGLTTLWTIQPCATTTTAAEVGTPPVLPATGGVPAPAFGGVLFAAGLVLLRLTARRPRTVDR